MTLTPADSPAADRIPALALHVHADGRSYVFADCLATPAGGVAVDGLRLRVDGGPTGLLALRLRREDGAVMAVDHLEFRFGCPILNFEKIVLPDSGRDFVFRDRALFLRSQKSGVTAKDDGHAFVALTDQQGRCVTSYGLVSHTTESQCYCVDPKLSARMAMVGGHDRLVLAMRAPSVGWTYGETVEIEETVWLGAPQPSWFEALRAYTEACRYFFDLRYPVEASAYDPTWCTWTAWSSDRMTPDAVLANARIAAELGMKTIILDDGWFGPGLDTDDRPLNIGDYYPDPVKLPDLKGLVAALQEIGLRVLLWYAPTCLSADAACYPSLRDTIMHDDKGAFLAPNGFHNLCPACPEARHWVRRETRRMLTDYGADGFKVDLFNCLQVTPCRAAHAHDHASIIAGTRAMMQDIWEITRELKPGGHIELKQNYGNFIDIQWGTMVRAGDTAYDVNTNLERCMYLQTYAPVVHNDYLACTIHDRPEHVAMMLIKQLLSGVPTFSIDLPRQPQGARDVIRAWLGFYDANRHLFAARRRPQNAAQSIWELVTGSKVLVGLTGHVTEFRLPRHESGVHSVHVLNATSQDQLTLRGVSGLSARVTRYDHAWQPIGGADRVLEDGARLDIPVGGAIVIHYA